jgi:hypothetical protein
VGIRLKTLFHDDALKQLKILWNNETRTELFESYKKCRLSNTAFQFLFYCKNVIPVLKRLKKKKTWITEVFAWLDVGWSRNFAQTKFREIVQKYLPVFRISRNYYFILRNFVSRKFFFAKYRETFVTK